jgi:hypothetical protein
MFNHSITQGYADDGGTVKTVTTRFTGQGLEGWDGVIAAGATNAPVDAEWLNANVQSLCVWSDQAVTIKTNSSTAPAQTINLLANQILQYGVNMGLTNPFTADVTALFVSNAGSTNANFKLRVLMT